MSPAERLIARQRAQLMKVEQNGMSEIVRAYQKVLRDLNARLAVLTRDIDQARAAGEEVSDWWLVRQQRYQDLIAQQEALTLDFLKDSLTTLEGTKRSAAGQADGDAPDLTKATMGPGPAHAEATIANSFSQLPSAQLERLVGYAADGRPLGLLLSEIAPKATTKVKDALLSGVARGAGVRTIATDVRKASGIAQNRALLITRSEVMRAYRTVSFESYLSSPVVTAWIWIAQADGCPVCQAEHGSEHSLDESLNSHPGCRCTAMPKTLSWANLGYPQVPDVRPTIQPGAERFAEMAEADKLAILGQARLDAYNSGEITLADMVKDTHSKRWGEGKRTATLAELGVG